MRDDTLMVSSEVSPADAVRGDDASAEGGHTGCIDGEHDVRPGRLLTIDRHSRREICHLQAPVRDIWLQTEARPLTVSVHRALLDQHIDLMHREFPLDSDEVLLIACKQRSS